MTPRQRLAAKIGAGAVTMVLPVVILYEGAVHITYKDPINKITACTGHTGRELPGLVKRRAAERQLCEKGLT